MGHFLRIEQSSASKYSLIGTLGPWYRVTLNQALNPKPFDGFGCSGLGVWRLQDFRLGPLGITGQGLRV